MDALSFDLMKQVNYMGTTREIWESIKDTFGDSSTWDNGKFKKEDEPKKEAHECVEHDHNLVIVKDCSTSWSSDDDDDRFTTSSLDKVDVDDSRNSSRAIDDSTPSTLDVDDDDGSCLGYESDVSTSSPTPPHCFLSHGDAKVFVANVVVDCEDPNFELVCRLNKALQN